MTFAIGQSPPPDICPEDMRPRTYAPFQQLPPDNRPHSGFKRDSDVINYRDGPMSGGAICWRGADIRRALIVARAGVRGLMLSEGECLDCLYR